jgi:hypothetical protein
MEESAIISTAVELESSPETQEKTLHHIVEDLAADYVNYAKFDSVKEVH